MNYFRQLYYDMHHNRMMTWVSVSGTALSIFLVLVFFMVSQVKTVGVAPENDRERILTGGGMDLHMIKDGQDQWSRSGSMSYKIARQMYDNLEGIEKITYTNAWTETFEVGVSNALVHTMTGKFTEL